MIAICIEIPVVLATVTRAALRIASGELCSSQVRTVQPHIRLCVTTVAMSIASRRHCHSMSFTAIRLAQVHGRSLFNDLDINIYILASMVQCYCYVKSRNKGFIECQAQTILKAML